MALILYHAYNSYASQKVRLHLAENNIGWNSHPIDLLKQEHINDEYIKINPRGLVPALVDNGKIILNSTDIMQYIDDNYTNEVIEKTLAKEIYDFCKLDEKLHDPHIRTLSYHYLWMKEEKSLEEVNKVLALAKKHPDKARGNFLAKAILRQITEEEITLARKEIIMALEQMEKKLQNSKADFLLVRNILWLMQ